MRVTIQMKAIKHHFSVALVYCAVQGNWGGNWGAEMVQW